MKINYSHIFFFLALCSIAIGCRTFTEPYPTNLQHLFPLAVGNYWMYDMEEFQDSDHVIEFSQTTEITGSEMVGKYQRYYIDYGNGSTDSVELFYSGQNLFATSDNFGRSLPILRYPMDVGETVVLFREPNSSNGFDQIILNLVGRDVAVEVPAGNFPCYQYKTVIMSGSDTTDALDSYYSHGVGLVKDIQYSNTSGFLKKSAVKLLKSYLVKAD